MLLYASMEPEQLSEILAYSATGMVKALAKLQADAGGVPTDVAAWYITDYALACADTAAALVPQAKEFVHREKQRMQQLSDAMANGDALTEPEDTDTRIFRRTYRSPVNRLASQTCGLAANEQAVKEYTSGACDKHRDTCVAEILIQYYMDGSHTVDEIASHVLFEMCGGSRDAVVQYIETLSSLGLCVLKGRTGMRHFLGKRTITAIICVLLVLVINFMLIHMAPANPARLLVGTETPSEEQVQAITLKYGLDQPMPVQFIRYVGNLLKGDMGVLLLYQRAGYKTHCKRAGQYRAVNPDIAVFGGADRRADEHSLCAKVGRQAG